MDHISSDDEYSEDAAVVNPNLLRKDPALEEIMKA
jgi:hypothetical protein